MSRNAGGEGVAPPEERKLATIMFADLVGFTALADSEDPERTRAMLNRFWEAMADEIVRTGGTVEKFAGDAVMAAFGAPTAFEDHAERALHAALAMRRRLAELFSGRLSLRIGINTGQVIVGPPGEGSSFVSGDAVNTAARLEQAAAPGEILAGERTAADAGGAFEFEPLATIEAKGKAHGIVSCRLVRAISLTRPRGVGGLTATFVGRDRELEELIDNYTTAVKAGRPQLITVLGNAGMGKTRLVRELWGLLAIRAPEPLRRTGRCLSYGTGSAYWALGEVLKEHFGLLDSDPASVVLERLAGREMLGLALGLDVIGDLHPLAARDRFQDAWAEFLTEITSRQPVALLFEDLHWAEAPLLDLIEFLLKSVQGPLLVVATARPELLERRRGWGTRAGGALLELEPLSEDSSTRMIEALLVGALPGDVSQLVVRRAEGNPFFVEELLEMLIDKGVLTRQDGGWTSGEIPSDFAIPDSIHAVLAARIDLLGPVEKRALQAAAVVGRIFWAGPVYELVPGNPDLRVLEDRDFIRRRGTTSMAGEREYAIKHALTREVAYASLTRAQRARMHADFATWLEQVSRGRDEFAAMLAHHYAAAVRPEDADLAWAGQDSALKNIRGKAMAWLERAAQLAMGRCEIEDALTLLRQALSLEPDEEAQARIWRAVGTANALKYDGEAFLAAMQRSLTFDTIRATRANTYSELAFQAAIRSGMWKKLPDRAVVNGWIDNALALADSESVPRARALIARCMWDRSEAGAAQEALLIAERLGDRSLRSYAMGAQSEVAMASRDFEAALDWTNRRLDLVGEISDPDHLADLYETAIPCLCATAHFEQARSLAVENRKIVETLSAHHRLHGVAVILEVEENCGEWQRILDLADQTEAAVDANLATPCIRNAHSLLVTAVAAAYVGNEAASRRYEGRADEVANEGYEVVLAGTRTWLSLARGEMNGLDELINLLDISQARSWNALVTAAARLDALAAKRDQAHLEQEAPALLRHHTYLEPFALRALGVVQQNDALIEQAAERFETIGLEWHSQQTRRLVAHR